MLRELRRSALTIVQHSRAFSTFCLPNPSFRVARTSTPLHGKAQCFLHSAPVTVSTGSFDASWSSEQVILWVESHVALSETVKSAIVGAGVRGSDLPEFSYKDWTDFGLEGFKAKKLMNLIYVVKKVSIDIRQNDPKPFVLKDQQDLEKILIASSAVGIESVDTRQFVTNFREVEDGKHYKLVAVDISVLSKVVDEQQYAKNAIKSRAEYALPALFKKATGLTITYRGSDIKLELRGKEADIGSLFESQETPSTRIIMERRRHAKDKVLDQMKRTRDLYQDIVGPDIRIISVLFAEACPETVILDALQRGYFVLTTGMELQTPSSSPSLSDSAVP